MTDTTVSPQATPAGAPAISHAYVRKPGPDFGQAQGGIGIPDPDRALYQHDAVCRALVQCGVEVRALKYDPAYPDGCFLDDTAVIAGNLAVIGNFTEQTARHGEQQLAASVLAGSRIIKCITAPGTLDAADVAVVDGHYFIGISAATNHEGAAQLAYFLGEFGYGATVLDIGAGTGLRLGHALCHIGTGVDGRPLVMLREDLARHYAFIAMDKIIVPWHARGVLSSLMINGHLLMPTGYPAVAQAVTARGVKVTELQVSEFAKMDGGLKSLSLRLPAKTGETVVSLTDIRSRRAA